MDGSEPPPKKGCHCKLLFSRYKFCPLGLINLQNCLQLSVDIGEQGQRSNLPPDIQRKRVGTQ